LQIEQRLAGLHSRGAEGHDVLLTTFSSARGTIESACCTSWNSNRKDQLFELSPSGELDMIVGPGP